MNPKIEFYGNRQVLKFHFDNGLTLRAIFYQDKTQVTVERAGKELKNCECICYTADAFADTLHEYSAMSQKKAKRIVMPPNIGPWVLDEHLTKNN